MKVFIKIAIASFLFLSFYGCSTVLGEKIISIEVWQDNKPVRKITDPEIFKKFGDAISNADKRDDILKYGRGVRVVCITKNDTTKYGIREKSFTSKGEYFETDENLYELLGVANE